jgi:outer membrane protein
MLIGLKIKLRMKKILGALYILLCTHTSQAQNSIRINLQKALSLAVSNSKQLMISKTSLQQAQAKLAQANDKAWPEIKATATYLRINKPTIDFRAPSDNSGTGGGSSLGAAFANLHDIALAQLSLSQPLFAGFRIRNARVMQKYLSEAAAYDTTTTKNKVLVTTATAIYQYYQLLQTRNLVEENLKQAQQRVTEFKNLEAQSLVARNDRLKAELQANKIELTRIEINNNLALAEYNLGILLGLSDNTRIELDTTAMFKTVTTTTWEECLQNGINNRSEIKSAQLQAQAGETGTRMARASRYPSLALTAAYINAYLPNVLTVTNALNGGIGLQYNLTGALNSRHLIQEAKAQQRKAELAQQITNDQVRGEIKKNFLNYQTAIEKIRLSRLAIEQAQENYNIVKNKFNAGLVIMSDYLDADVTLLQAKINFATAQAESMIAYYDLEESIGSIQ